MQATQITLSRTFSTTGVVEHYHVPKYQREYTWGKNQWSQLLQDIEENDRQYFMGSIICIRQPSEAGLPAIYDLVDGQQRLTTLSIILAGWYANYKDYCRGIEDEEELVNLNNVKKMLVQILDANGDQRAERYNNKSLYMRVRPSVQGGNLDDYRYLLSKAGILKDIEKPKFWGLRRIAKCFRFFKKNLPVSKEDLETLKDKFESLNFIHINADSQADAFVLFESLNNRGVPLSIMDIVKNKMLAELETSGQLNIDEAFEKWKMLLEHLPDYKWQERFLRHYYNAFKNERNLAIEGASRAIRSKLVKIYEKLISNGDAKALLNQLIKSSDIYASLVYPEMRKDDHLKLHLRELSYLGAAPAFAFILFTEELNLLSKEDKPKVLNLLCDYFFRRNLTDRPPTRSIDKIFLDLINDIDTYSFETIEEALTQHNDYPVAPLSYVEELLSDKMYDTSSDLTRFALYRIESGLSDGNFTPDLWARNKSDRLIWTVEHILPQNDNMRSEWVDMIAGGNFKEAKEIKAAHGHKLGNLTLTPYNSKLTDKPLNKKQTLTTDNIHGNAVETGLKSGLALNKEVKIKKNGDVFTLGDIPQWTEEEIKIRTNVMVQILLEQIKFSWEK